jgi:two-component system NtrC family response regulator
VICATHQDLPELISRGDFREDLYYRINEATIQVPALRERAGDAVLLARAFLERYATQLKRPIKGFTPQALHAVEQYAWPGNVRELENRVKRAVIMADGARVTGEDLEIGDLQSDPEPFNLREVREAAESRAIRRAMSHSQNNVSKTAELLGVTRPTLYNLMRKYAIKE